MKPTYGRLREKKTYFRVWLHATLRKLDFHFLSNRLGYDRGDSFLFDFEPNGIPFEWREIYFCEWVDFGLSTRCTLYNRPRGCRISNSLKSSSDYGNTYLEGWASIDKKKLRTKNKNIPIHKIPYDCISIYVKIESI